MFASLVVLGQKVGPGRRRVKLDLMVHGFHAIAFAENFTLKDLAPGLGEPRRSGRDLSASPPEGARWVYPFGVVVFRDTGAAGREHALDQLRQARSGQTTTRILSE